LTIWCICVNLVAYFVFRECIVQVNGDSEENFAIVEPITYGWQDAHAWDVSSFRTFPSFEPDILVHPTP
jgi:hypothetical protein